MSRTATLNPKARTSLLEAATGLMMAKGYNGTSVEDICAAAKVTKGSFFHYFESKEELGRAALQGFCEAMGRQFEQAIGAEKDPWKRVLRYLDAVEGMAKSPAATRGCLLGEFSNEMCDCSSGIQAMCCGAFEHWTAKFAGELAAAKKATSPRAAWKPREVAEHFIAVIEGSLLMAKAKRDAGILARNVRHFRAYLQGLAKA